MWLDIPRMELYVERVDKEQWRFRFGLDRYVRCIHIPNTDESDDDDEVEVDEVEIMLPKDTVHSHMSGSMMCYSLIRATETLNSLVNQKHCIKCRRYYSTYSPHGNVCGACYLKMDRYEVDDNKCVICLKETYEMDNEIVRVCGKCNNPVCMECFPKLKSGEMCDCCTTGKVSCPCCRDKNYFDKMFLVEAPEKKEITSHDISKNSV
jgi:hypothetical protein